MTQPIIQTRQPKSGSYVQPGIKLPALLWSEIKGVARDEGKSVSLWLAVTLEEVLRGSKGEQVCTKK